MATQDVQEFVQTLQQFHDTLPAAQQAMLATIIEAAQGDETAGYRRNFKRTETLGGEDETSGYSHRLFGRSEPQIAKGSASVQPPRGQEDETSGYGVRRSETLGDETAGYGVRDSSGEPDEGRAADDAGNVGDLWQKLTVWLVDQEDETEGFRRTFR